MSATLKLTRESIVLELRRGVFEIMVDGKSVGTIDRHGAVETPIQPGPHTLRVREGRYSSRDQSVDVADGEVASFRCNGARIWPIYLASLVVPSLALTLRRE